MRTRYIPLILMVAIAAIAVSLEVSHRTKKVYPVTLEGRVLIFAAKYPDQDCIVISKSKHLMYYCDRGFMVRSAEWDGFSLTFPAPIAIGMGGRFETPAGEYYICQKNPDSRYTLFLGLSWPNIADANKAIELGSRLSAYDYRRIVAANMLRQQPPWDTPLGGTYGIHGAPTYMKYAVDRMEKANPDLVYVTKKDNTRGCVAVEHRYLRFLFAKVDEGTPVLILN